jgi:hypothetical protein
MRIDFFQNVAVLDFNESMFKLNSNLHFNRQPGNTYYTEVDEIKFLSSSRDDSKKHMENLLLYLKSNLNSDNCIEMSRVIAESVAVYEGTIKICDTYMLQRYALRYDDAQEAYFPTQRLCRYHNSQFLFLTRNYICKKLKFFHK